MFLRANIFFFAIFLSIVLIEVAVSGSYELLFKAEFYVTMAINPACWGFYFTNPAVFTVKPIYKAFFNGSSGD